MSHLTITLHWHRASPVLRTDLYSNEHTIHYNSHLDLPMDAAPDQDGNPANTNPEQALASALSSCHMMTFLALTAKLDWPVASYHDYAETHLGKNAKKQMSVMRIDLNPVMRFDTNFTVSAEDLAQMQDHTHQYYFIANTLADNVEINIH